MAKRRALERGGGGGREWPQRRHLYLLFDDWPSGYSIRKVRVDLPSDAFGPDDGEMLFCACEQRLPPAIFRLEAQRGLPMYFAAAFDSKILAMQPIAPGTALPSVLEDQFPVFDVRTRSCLFGPRMETTGANPIYIPAGGRLFALASGTFDWLDPLDPPPIHLDRSAYGEEARLWSWLELPDPPFQRYNVTSYAVHPDGQTIFVSTKKDASATTFAFETEEHGGIWNRHGKWMLPFLGRAHYDGDLDAWVGLSRDPDSIGHICSCDVVPVNPYGGGDSRCPARKISKEKLFRDDLTEWHVGATLVYTGGRSEFCLVQCVSVEDDGEGSDCNLEDEEDSADEKNGCDLEEEDDSDDGCDMEVDDCPADERKDCDLKEKEQLQHSSAASAAERKVCDLKEQLQQSSAASAPERDDSEEDGQDVTSPSRRYLLRLTTFTLKYDRNGDLTTGRSCRVRYYRVPRESTLPLLYNPVAFWM
ncbi:unnamed protein product [Urochloa humidicola]